VKPARSLASRLKDRIRIERPVADTALDGAGSGDWELVGEGEVAAEVQDMLPSRGERMADGVNVASRPARVRLRFRDDIKPSMRFVMGATVVDDVVDYSGARIMQIKAGPAKLGRDGVEFMVEDYSTAGNPA
jgi:head-tail adaptor